MIQGHDDVVHCINKVVEVGDTHKEDLHLILEVKTIHLAIVVVSRQLFSSNKSLRNINMISQNISLCSQTDYDDCFYYFQQ